MSKDDGDEFLWGDAAGDAEVKPEFRVNERFASRYTAKMRDERIAKRELIRQAWFLFFFSIFSHLAARTVESEVNALEESIESEEEVEDEIGELGEWSVPIDFALC